MATGETKLTAEPTNVEGLGAPVRIDSRTATPNDRSDAIEELKVTSLIGQRDTLLRAMVKVFTGLNGGVYLLTAAAWGWTAYSGKYPIVTENVLMSLIGATVVQAGIAFLAITRFLFPPVNGESNSKQG